VYTRDSGIWQRQALLQASHRTLFANFGELLTLQGDRLAICAGGELDFRGDPLGAAYLFAREGVQWSEAIRVVGSDITRYQRFGRDAVALDRGWLIIGVPNHGNGGPIRLGAVYDYELICAGDVNGDWRVEAVDLAIVLAAFGTPGGETPDDGDLDRDGDVDLADLALVLGHFGDQCP
jgi:hypothetical protein